MRRSPSIQYLVLGLALLAVVGYVPAATGTTLIGGTVLAIDLEAPAISVQLPKGESWLLPVVNRSLLKDIKVGDHVSLELNGDGRITKLVKLPIDAGN